MDVSNVTIDIVVTEDSFKKKRKPKIKKKTQPTLEKVEASGGGSGREIAWG